MKVKTLFINDVDIVNYKETCCYIGVGYTCSLGCPGCQNEELKGTKPITTKAEKIVENYLNTPITHAIVFAGLEPLEDMNNVEKWIKAFRKSTDDPIIIFTGREEDSTFLRMAAKTLKPYSNIIFKVGRYIEGHEPHYDKLLGVNLASDNQRGIMLEEVIGKCE